MEKFIFKLNEKGAPALIGMVILIGFISILILTGLGLLGLIK